MLVIASIGWVLVTLTLWASAVWLIESDEGEDMDRSVRHPGRDQQ